jgi:hypothetical protein
MATPNRTPVCTQRRQLQKRGGLFSVILHAVPILHPPTSIFLGPERYTSRTPSCGRRVETKRTWTLEQSFTRSAYSVSLRRGKSLLIMDVPRQTLIALSQLQFLSKITRSYFHTASRTNSHGPWAHSSACVWVKNQGWQVKIRLNKMNKFINIVYFFPSIFKYLQNRSSTWHPVYVLDTEQTVIPKCLVWWNKPTSLRNITPLCKLIRSVRLNVNRYEAIIWSLHNILVTIFQSR